MKKRLFSIFLAAIMVLFMMPVKVRAGGPTTDWQVLTSVLDNQNAGAGQTAVSIDDSNTNFRKITLLKDISAEEGDSTLEVSADKEIILDLNGYTIDGKIDDSISVGSVIKIPSGATLTLRDDSTSKTGKITGGNTTEGGGGVYVEGTLNMYSGTVTGNKATDNGGGVYVNGGTFTMNGGTITQNNAGANKNGGGVYVVEGSFTMTGNSVVSNNNAYNGGGVYIFRQSTFTMSGNSQISNNNAGNSYGAVYIGDSELSISENSKIEENSAINCGGVCIWDSTVTMTGGSICNNNATKNYGGVVMSNSTLKMTGGRISGNTATTNFGGVYFGGGTLTLGGTAVITGNTAKGASSNVYLAKNKTFDINTPSSGMSVGVSTQTDPTAAAPTQITTNGSLTDTGYFSSDNDAYEVKFVTDHLVLSVKPHTHNLVKVDGQPATEEASGWKDYYECDEIADACHMYFEDSDGNTSITDFEAWKAEGGNGYIAKLNAPKYGITVLNDGNGTASASVSEAASGTAVTLTATPASGYVFDAWEVVSGGINITGDTFTMPGNAVEVKAKFKSTTPTPNPPEPSPEPEEEPYYIESLEDQLDVAIAYSQEDETILWTAGDSLPQSVIDLILQSDVTVEFKFTYEGVDYDLFLNKFNVKDLKLDWYGPYVLAQFANNTAVGAEELEGDTYTVKEGDTMGAIAERFGMSLEALTALNPQITDIDFIRVNQKIRVK